MGTLFHKQVDGKTKKGHMGCVYTELRTKSYNPGEQILREIQVVSITTLPGQVKTSYLLPKRSCYGQISSHGIAT